MLRFLVVALFPILRAFSEHAGLFGLYAGQAYKQGFIRAGNENPIKNQDLSQSTPRTLGIKIKNPARGVGGTLKQNGPESGPLRVVHFLSLLGALSGKSSALASSMPIMG